MFDQSNQRTAGVMTPEGQRSGGKGLPKTVSHCIPVETFAVEYVDDAGDVHATIMLKVNGTWYLAPNGENYAKTLKPVGEGSWLGKLLSEKTRAAAPVPQADNVDVVG